MQPMNNTQSDNDSQSTNGRQALSQDEHNSVPAELTCPISGELFENPVVTKYGHTFEKSAIERWLDTNQTCPLTRKPLRKQDLFPNFSIKALVERYQLHQAQSRERNRSSQPQQNPSESNSNTFFKQATAASSERHTRLMQTLAQDFGVEFTSVHIASVVEQAMAGYAGVYSNQSESSYRATQAVGETRFHLRLNPAEQRKLAAFYNERLPNLIKSVQRLNEQTVELVVHTGVLSQTLSPQLGQFHKNSHKLLMQMASQHLQVQYNDVYLSDALETALVRRAGIGTSQSLACFRSNPDYSTRFGLHFASAGERTQFIAYYQERHPGLILRADPEVNGLIHMNSAVLLRQVLPALAPATNAQQLPGGLRG